MDSGPGSGFRVHGAGCKVPDAGCRVQGSVCRVEHSGDGFWVLVFGFWGLGLRCWGLNSGCRCKGFGVYSVRFGVCVVRFGVWGAGFKGLGFGDRGLWSEVLGLGLGPEVRIGDFEQRGLFQQPSTLCRSADVGQLNPQNRSFQDLSAKKNTMHMLHCKKFDPNDFWLFPHSERKIHSPRCT